MTADFRNETIPAEALPGFETVRLDAVSPHFARYRLLSVGVRWLAVALVLGVLPGAQWAPWLGHPGAPLLALLPGTLFGWLAWLEARRRGWALREHDLIYRSGLLVTRTTVLPFARVQHVETVSTPLERAFGLVRTICYTAGGVSADLIAAGLDQDTAGRVREYLLRRIRTLEPEPATETDAAAEPAAAAEPGSAAEPDPAARHGRNDA